MPASQAHISIYDLGVVMGATVTDLMRTFRHTPYRLKDHVERFYESCVYTRIVPRETPEQTAQATRELIEHNTAFIDEPDDLAVVWFATGGENLVYAGSAASAGPTAPTFCIHSFKLPFSSFRKMFLEGVHLVTPSTRHIPPECVDPKIKNRSRLHWWLAEREAHLVDPQAIPLLLDLHGNITETSGANFLIVKKGKVISPGCRNILRGVSRKVVIELCATLAIPFDERDIQLHDALTADEAFLTTTPYCMAPVTRINGLNIGGGGVHKPIFERLLSAWSREAGVDIRGQVLGRDAAKGEAI